MKCGPNVESKAHIWLASEQASAEDLVPEALVTFETFPLEMYRKCTQQSPTCLRQRPVRRVIKYEYCVLDWLSYVQLSRDDVQYIPYASLTSAKTNL